MRRLIILVLLSSLFLSLACKTGPSPEEAGKIRVGIVFDIGGKDDKSFNAAAWEGVKRAAKDLPIVLRDVEPGEPTSLEPSMRAFAERGYDLIIGIGFAQAPIMESVAKDYPNLNFAIVDSVIELPNVASLVFDEHEGCFLVGMIAARTTKTNKIGFVGGMDIPLIRKFAKGYEEGIHYVNPKCEVYENFVGINDAAWNNPGKGKELAKAQFDKGADIVFQAAGNSGIGVFDAAEEVNRFAIGVDSNQNWMKPGIILTSMVKRVDVAVYSTVKEVVEKKFKAGIHSYGLQNDGITFALDQYNQKLIPQTVIDEVDAARQKIIKQEIKVTNIMAK
ncbi:MAG TPA: BMP family ABC transporter substrate-binding protein [Acidobacteriota bacterium]|nr:BMP family ABC transporter substrate-binding protein [Acidobacteriota bacterium]HMZ81631.1 BMP family ABC transporter substrate-binding protein [Acidobacteriota bacterium]HNB70537.1 BMP family ABC transporter substrate-binding protein [Acidobacteriota bacterium]HND18304.1 BMP family ABC transporter substrate-binding protein [Acidobacteriota bacterium]HNG92294.1 BMP family ABC transporter substrate-binding protein [Acidobacteriota bacterium]